MSVLYDILSPKDLEHLSEDKKKEFLSEIITFGKIEYFEKFKNIMKCSIFEIISGTDILKVLPMVIDPELFKIILDSYDFEQGQHFFYNYATYNTNKKIKEMVYDYFVDNYSHVLFDKMEKYGELLEN